MSMRPCRLHRKSVTVIYYYLVAIVLITIITLWKYVTNKPFSMENIALKYLT
jgi:hypothetical protein